MPTLPGPLELILILVIVTMLFGVGKLPEVFGAVGRGIREFRKASSEEGKEGNVADVETEVPATTKATVEGSESR
jgi:sec-independent protein translocase protein TatA